MINDAFSFKGKKYVFRIQLNRFFFFKCPKTQNPLDVSQKHNTFVWLPNTHTRMNPTHIEHIGIAVKSLAESLPFWETLLGTKCYAIEEVKEQRVKTAFLKVGQTKIELLESTDPEGPIGKFIEKKGEGVHHLAFAVENSTDALTEAGENGIALIDEVSRRGAEGMNIGFLHPKSTHGVLLEFCSK
jgi:methylmalonyl-CoA/ethylmalonyl-CoA epimerase